MTGADRGVPQRARAQQPLHELLWVAAADFGDTVGA